MFNGQIQWTYLSELRDASFYRACK